MVVKIATFGFIVVILCGALGATAAISGEAASETSRSAISEANCNTNNNAVTVTKTKVALAKDGSDRQQSVELMRKTNRQATEIIWREMGQQGFVYFIDPTRSLDCIEAELDALIGGSLEFAVSHHKRRVDDIISTHLDARGWPAAIFIQLRGDARPNICIISPFSHEKTSVEFVSHMLGDRGLPVVHQVGEYVLRYLSAVHEGYHCIISQRGGVGVREITLLELTADIGAANEALALNIGLENILALADWRAISFASGIADVVAGRVAPKDTYAAIAPSRMSTVGIIKLLSIGHRQDFEEVLKLIKQSTPLGLFGRHNQVERYTTEILLLSKNVEAVERYPNATLFDVDDILAIIGAPWEIIEAVRNSISRYVSLLDCRWATSLVCRQSDNSFVIAADAIVGIARPNDQERSLEHSGLTTKGTMTAEQAKVSFADGRQITFPSHEQYHRSQSERRGKSGK